MKRINERYEEREEISSSKSKKGVNQNVIIAVCIAASVIAGGIAGGLLAGPKNNDGQASTYSEETTAPLEAETSRQTPEPQVSEAPQVTAEPVKAEQGSGDLISAIEASRISSGMSKRCYLTFDDGPSPKVTGVILDTLGKYGIKATFFEVGKNIRKYPDITKRVYNEGHLVANHSYSHDYNKLYETESSFKSEIEQCEEAIKDVTGQTDIFKLMRFPGGSYNAGDHAAQKQVYKNTLSEMGYYYCDWNALNGDAEGKEKSSTELIEYFKKGAAEFISQDKNLIVLMHDSDVKQATADALETIIQYMTEQGYTFHRLDDFTL